MLVDLPAMEAASGLGRVTASRMKAALIRTCMNNIHHLLVFTISTNGPQANFSSQGRYRRLVNLAFWSFGTPRLVNIRTEMVFTMK